MGNSDAATPTKSDNASPPVQQEQPFIHPYPDWATMQAYYRQGATMPPPFFNAAVASGHAPHAYMWGPQPFMPPYGTPYPAIYTHGVYSHPMVPLGSHSFSQGIAVAPPTGTNEATVMATPLSIEPPSKSSSNKGRGLLKKLKGLEGLPVSTDGSNAENTSSGGLSLSGESGAGGSSDGGNEGEKTHRRSSEDSLTSGKENKITAIENTIRDVETKKTPDVPLEASMAPASITVKRAGSAPSSSSMLGTEGRVSANNGDIKAAPVPPPPSTNHWMQDERTLKREKRKQSNRESARRSRMRKQAETEELAIKVEALGTENTTLRSEIIRLREDSEKLRLENSALMEKLAVAEVPPAPQAPPSVATKNFLSRVHNPSSFSGSSNQERGVHGSSSDKLHRHLDPSSRTDAMAAG